MAEETPLHPTDLTNRVSELWHDLQPYTDSALWEKLTVSERSQLVAVLRNLGNLLIETLHFGTGGR